MPDIEKVIKGLECCSVENDWNCNDCPYGNPNVPISECMHPLLNDAVALLKERELRAVPVVWCNDCKYWDTESGLTVRKCGKHDRFTVQFGFCSDGERKEDATD